MKLKDLANLDEKQLTEAVRALIGTVESSEQAIAKLKAELALLESKYGSSSEDFLSKVECEQREANPEINRWATIFDCYQDLTKQVQFA